MWPRFTIRNGLHRFCLALAVAATMAFALAGCGNGAGDGGPGRDGGPDTDSGGGPCPVATISWGTPEQVIDGDIGIQNVLRFAADDTPYIATFRWAYVGLTPCGNAGDGMLDFYDLVFLEPDGAGGWNETIVDTVPYLVTPGLTMELDPGSDEPAIAYTGIGIGTFEPLFSCGAHDLLVQTRTGSTWSGPDTVMENSNTGDTCPVIQDGCNVGEVTGAWPSLVFTGPGQMAIAYRDNHNGWNKVDFSMADLEVATGSPGSWANVGAHLALGGGGYSTITLDAADNPMVAHEIWSTGVGMTRMIDDGMGGLMWDTLTVTSQRPGERVQLAVATDGTIYIAFSTGPPAPGLYAAVSTDGGDTWEIQTVDSNGVTGLFPSLHLTDADVPVIASYRCSDPGEASCSERDDKLRIAYYSCGDWRALTVEGVDDENKTDGLFPSLDIDSAGELVIVFQEQFGDPMGNLFRSLHMVTGSWD